MFALRRAAARAVFTQPTRQLSTSRPAPRISALHSQKLVLCRPFHQSWRALAEEDQNRPEASPAEASTGDETVTTEPTPEEQTEIREESVVSPDIDAVSQAQDTANNAAEHTQEKAEEVSSQAQSAASSAAETVQDIASSAAQTVQNAASRVAKTARNRSAPGGAGEPPAQATILYVGNLFFEVTTDQLQAEFSRFGEVINTRIVHDGRGMSKGFGYIEYARPEDADRARELDQKVFQGRRMAVQFHVPRDKTDRRQPFRRPINPPSKTLFIGNMSSRMSDRDLNDLFREIRNVLDVRVAIDRRTGQPRGFAHADFIDVESAEKAKAHLEKKVVYGAELRVDFSTSSPSNTRSEETERRDV